MEFYEKAAPVIPRPNPMKVLVLSLPRTGTTSICAALRQLGLNPYHFSEASKNKNNEHFQLWLQAVRAKYDGIGIQFRGEDFDRILWNYDALSDDPCCLFIDELLSAYPNAQVILTTRDRSAWLRSMQRFILEILSWRSMRILSYFDPEFTGPYQALLNRTTTVLSQGQPPCAPSSVPALLASFDSHYDRVRTAVPGDRLLEFHPGMGWEPLCKFLGVGVPEVAFPHMNSGPDAMKLEVELYWNRWGAVGKRFVRRVIFLLGFWGLLACWRSGEWFKSQVTNNHHTV